MEVMKLKPEQQELLNGQKKWLVERADAMAKMAAKNDDWRSQIRGLLDATREETEVEVIRLFVQYQAARNKKQWVKPQDVASEMLRNIEACRSFSGDDAVLALALIQHLCCYAYRSYTYQKNIVQGGNGNDGE